MNDVNRMSDLSAEKMEELFQKSIRDSRKFLALSLIWVSAFIALHFLTSNELLKQAIVRAFLYATGFWFLMNLLKQLLFYRLLSVRLSDVKDARIGNFEVSEIRQVVENLLKNQNPQLVEHTLVDHNSRSLTNRVLFLHRNAE